MSKKRKSNKIAPRTTAEWVSLFISLLLLAVVVGIVIKLWVTETDEPARFDVKKVEMRNVDGQFHLPFILTNLGDQTAAEVTIEGKVEGSDETSSTTFDFIPGHARQEGVLIFSVEPTNAQVRVASYQQP